MFWMSFGGSAPSAPPAPAPPPGLSDEEKARIKALESRRERNRKGRRSTMLTSGQGDEGPAPLMKHTLGGR